MRLRTNTLLMLTLALLPAMHPAARATELTLGDTAAKNVTVDGFRDDLARLQTLVAACRASQSACAENQVGEDEQVHGGAGGQPSNTTPLFEEHWEWLRVVLHRSRESSAKDREHWMQEAQQQLAEMQQALAPATTRPAANDARFAAARKDANAVLRMPEFDKAVGTTWWDRVLMKLRRWLGMLFEGVGALGENAPWIGTALEWLLFLGAAVGLLVFILRTVARQRTRLALQSHAAATTAWQREPADWARLADANAEAGDWREAVHCLYWAAIVLLEQKRAWRHNPTRTPREYVRLLPARSAQQQALRELTSLLELAWYGHRDTTAEQFATARACYATLQESSALRSAGNAAQTAAGAIA
jgi:hypothetical protein